MDLEIKMAAVSNLPSAFSKSGNLFSICGADGKLKIWDTSAGVIRQEYIKNLHLSSPCTCLTWLQTPKTNTNKKRKLSSLQARDVEDIIAIGTATGTIILFSVVNNSVISEIEGHSSKVNAISYCSHLYSCSDDKHIIEWDLQSHKIKSKWKDGKNSVKAILALSCGTKLLTASSTIKLWNLETREILKKFTGHASEVFILLEVPQKNGYFISAAKGDRIINAWCANALEERSNALVGFVLQDSVAVVSVSSSQTFCAVSESGVLSVFQHKLNGTVSKPLKPKLNVTVATDCKGTSSPLLIHSVLPIDDGSALIAYGNPAFFTFETLVFAEHPSEHVVLIRETKRKQTSEEVISRNRAPNLSGDVEYITPGDALATPRKGAHMDVPLEKRLENLAVASPNVADLPRKDNMVQLLVQGLQSRDRDLINDVLYRQKETTIVNTVKHLPLQALHPLLKELSHLMQGKTLASRVAVRWLRHIFRTHAAILLSNPEFSYLMQPLLSTIEVKVSGLNGLLKLRGRLELLTEQMESSSADVQDYNVDPLITYQDQFVSDPDSSSSDSAEEWNEFPDMEDDDPDG